MGAGWYGTDWAFLGDRATVVVFHVCSGFRGWAFIHGDGCGFCLDSGWSDALGRDTVLGKERFGIWDELRRGGSEYISCGMCLFVWCFGGLYSASSFSLSDCLHLFHQLSVQDFLKAPFTNIHHDNNAIYNPRR